MDAGSGSLTARSGALWDEEPWDATAKVGDFGLSMKLDPAAGHISNMRQGTPFYAAPEVRDAGYLSKAADAFSFGTHLCKSSSPPEMALQMYTYDSLSRQRVCGSSGEL